MEGVIIVDATRCHRRILYLYVHLDNVYSYLAAHNIVGYMWGQRINCSGHFYCWWGIISTNIAQVRVCYDDQRPEIVSGGPSAGYYGCNIADQIEKPSGYSHDVQTLTILGQPMLLPRWTPHGLGGIQQSEVTSFLIVECGRRWPFLSNHVTTCAHRWI